MRWGGNQAEASPGGEDILHSPVMSCGNICEMLSTREAFRDLVSKFLMDRAAWRAVIHGVAKSWTRLSD